MTTKAIYLKHIKVIYHNPEGLKGKTIQDVLAVDDHSFFFKDNKGKMNYFCSFLTDREVFPGLSLDKDPMIKGFVKGQERLYIYPSVFDGNLFKDATSDRAHSRYIWTQKAMAFGVYDDHIKADYLAQMRSDYRDYLDSQLKSAKKYLVGAKQAIKDYETHNTNVR